MTKYLHNVASNTIAKLFWPWLLSPSASRCGSKEGVVCVHQIDGNACWSCIHVSSSIKQMDECGLSVCVRWTVLCCDIFLDGRGRMWPNLPRISKSLSARTLLLPLLPVATWHKRCGKKKALLRHTCACSSKCSVWKQKTWGTTGDAARERCGLQHCKMGGWHRTFIFLFCSGPTAEKPTWYWTERRRSATTAGPSCTAPTSRAAPTPWPTSTAAATRAGPLATGRALCTKVGPPAWKS